MFTIMGYEIDRSPLKVESAYRPSSKIVGLCQNSCEDQIEENLATYVWGRGPPVVPLNLAILGV